MMIRKLVMMAVVGVAVGGCAVGPDYQRPEVTVGENYKQLQDDPRNEGWVLVDDLEQRLPRDWWALFDDTVLDAMMQQLEAQNFDLQRAEALYRQAQATLQGSRAGFFPTLGAETSTTRSGTGGPGAPQTQYNLSGNLSWELDLWGRVRRSVEADEAGLQASKADLAGTQLSLQVSLAQTYFQLLVKDTELALMDKTIQAYERGLSTTRNQVAAGVAAPADIAAATMQLDNAKTQRQGLVWQRGQLEHALAVLQGVAPADFSLPSDAEVPEALPTIPISLPATLLQQRPDVVAAEQQTREANAQIGVAQSAWFPDLTLSAQGGWRSGQWAQWLTAPSQFWSLGPALALTLFDGGARRANISRAQAAHEAQAANYKQTVLTALQEVEDVLLRLTSMEQELQTQESALAAANESLRLTRNQYEAGMIDYLSVMQLETSALNAQRSLINLKGEKVGATIDLIAALGGGWSGIHTPDASDAMRAQ